MRSFLFALTALLLLGACILWYALSMRAFSDELLMLLHDLPDTEEEYHETREAAEEVCEVLLEKWQSAELFVHLAVPHERMESFHEKLLFLRQYLQTDAYPDYRAYLALCFEEADILKSFETVTLPNLV